MSTTLRRSGSENMRHIWIYDIETYEHLFSIVIENWMSGRQFTYEVSRRRNDAAMVVAMMRQFQMQKARMIGFNSEHFDYPIIHHLVKIFYATGSFSALDAFNKAQQIIHGDRFENNVWPSERMVEQIDLFKIMHFDNIARSTSLKRLEMNMRSGRVIDLPFPIDRNLSDEEIDIVLEYNSHDVSETGRFAREIWNRVEFRDQLGPEWINFNDTKIGKQTFIDELEKAGVQCFDRSSGRKVPIQTPRSDGVNVGENLIPIPFETPELKRVWTMFKNITVHPMRTKGALTASASLGNFKMHFGTGGIHGSINSTTVRSDEEYQIVDVDVTSYYPSLAIQWGFHPKHLGPKFVDVYRELKQRRTSYPKKSAPNEMLKLALNGVYGDSNNKYGPFYDPAYMLAITTNGQMLLAWLAELLWLNVPNIELIQINTDGLTVRVPHSENACGTFPQILDYWQKASLMDLEDVNYDWMAIRDVNNYIAQPIEGKRKRKGGYDIITNDDHLGWHKNQSTMVVQKAIDAVIDGADLAEFIWQHDDKFDFMHHVKVPRNSRLELGGKVVQSTSRYYVALNGSRLIKVMPPLAAKPDQERKISVNEGWNVSMCNDVKDFDWSNLNRMWYYQEAKSLITSLGWF